MKRRLNSVVALAVILAAASVAFSVAAVGAEPPAAWVQTYAPVRTLYVAPDASGSGESAQAPMSLLAAIEKAQPGDLYWLAEGRYTLGEKEVKFNAAGTKDKPIVFRATPGKRVTIDGHIAIFGGYTWIWGMEFIDPALLAVKRDRYDIHSVTVMAVGTHLINNVMHNSGGGIGGWNYGPDQVYYGNIIYGAGGDVNPSQKRTNYPTYTQNDYDKYGYKYYVQNMFFDARPHGGNYNFHAYTEGGTISGYVLRQNVLANGQVVFRGGNRPHYYNILDSNCFYQTPSVNLGWEWPFQAQFTNNYLGRSGLEISAFWGITEIGKKKPLPNIYTGNTIISPPKGYVGIRTSGGGPEVGGKEWNVVWGQARLDPKDTFDNNTYSPVFTASLEAAGKTLKNLDLAGWQGATEAAGEKCDANSRVVPLPAEPKVFVFANEYEPGRGHAVIYNWSKADAVTVDLSAILAKGAQFTVHAAKKSFDTPLVSGTYDQRVSIPMKGEEFGAFLVRTVVK